MEDIDEEEKVAPPILFKFELGSKVIDFNLFVFAKAPSIVLIEAGMMIEDKAELENACPVISSIFELASKVKLFKLDVPAKELLPINVTEDGITIEDNSLASKA